MVAFSVDLDVIVLLLESHFSKTSASHVTVATRVTSQSAVGGGDSITIAETVPQNGGMVFPTCTYGYRINCLQNSLKTIHCEIIFLTVSLRREYAFRDTSSIRYK